MQLRCKAGDLALVVFDTPPCASNVGRAVVVRGPVRIAVGRGPTWLVQPVTADPWAVERMSTGLVEFYVPPLDDVEHPDAWLLPIRPDLPSDTEGSDERVDSPVVVG